LRVLDLAFRFTLDAVCYFHANQYTTKQNRLKTCVLNL
jgi:hypothetical protein